MSVDLGEVNDRVKRLASAQSLDIQARLERRGRACGARELGRLSGPSTVLAETFDGRTESFEADAVLVSTGARPRIVAGRRA